MGEERSKGRWYGISAGVVFCDTVVDGDGTHIFSQLKIESLEARRLLSVNVLTWHNDLTRQGQNTNEVMLTPSNVNTSTFGALFSYPVQGQVYAQPLYVSNLTIPGKGTHNVIFVVTENNDVYALDANSNSGVGGGVLWHVNLGLAAAMPNTFFGNRYGPYHDINPQVGITSTPVIDLSTNTMYIDAFTNDVAGQNVYSHHIHALDITTGADKMTPMLVAASVQGNGVDGNGTTVPFVATQQLQRPALTLLNGVLYVAYSGYADTDPYHGWILGIQRVESPTSQRIEHDAECSTPTPMRARGGFGRPATGWFPTGPICTSRRPTAISIRPSATTATRS